MYKKYKIKKRLKLEEEYGNINPIITNEEKETIINKYKKSHNLTEEDMEDIEFNNIFNKKILFDRAINIKKK